MLPLKTRTEPLRRKHTAQALLRILPRPRNASMSDDYYLPNGVGKVDQ